MPEHNIGELITALNDAVNKLNNLRTKHDDLEKENARLREVLHPFIHTGNIEQGYRIGQNPPPPTASEEDAFVHYGGNEFHFRQWLQWRAVKIGRELLGEEE